MPPPAVLIIIASDTIIFTDRERYTRARTHTHSHTHTNTYARKHNNSFSQPVRARLANTQTRPTLRLVRWALFADDWRSWPQSLTDGRGGGKGFFSRCAVIARQARQMAPRRRTADSIRSTARARRPPARYLPPPSPTLSPHHGWPTQHTYITTSLARRRFPHPSLTTIRYRRPGSRR